MSNYETFKAELTKHYRELFTTPEYALAAARYTPEELAKKFTDALRDNGNVNKDGHGLRRTCKALGINHTYKAMSAYLNDGEGQ